jgi:hypothetical protein
MSENAGPLAGLGEIINQSSTVRGQISWAAEMNRSGPARAQTGVAQLWLNTALISGRTQDKRIANLARLAVAYNSHRKGKTRTDRINELHELQVAGMKWLDDFSVPDQNVSSAALWVKDLMNEVQREHQGLVEASVEQEDDTPPVANFDKLSDKEQRVVKSIWEQLVKGTGNIRITETETYTNSETNQPDARVHGGFRYEALAQFARLLETATGRSIVGQVVSDAKGRLVTIKPGFAEPSQGAPGSEFAAAPVSLEGHDKLTSVDINAMFKGQPNAKKKREAYRRKFVEIDLARIADPREKSAAIYEARKDNPKAAGVKIAGAYYKFGRGTAVDVTLTRDIRDAEEHHTSRFVDKDRNEIPTPNFITLGHELGHAVHMLTGVALGKQEISDQLLPLVATPGVVEQDWSNLEEYANINSVENALRAEFGMKSRYGHINQASVQKSLLEPIADRFYALSDLQPQPLRATVEAPLGPVGLGLVQLKIPQVRTGLKLAVTAFLGQMDTAFPRFTVQEKGAIRTPLNQVKTKVDSAKPDVLTAALASVNLAIQLVTQAKTRVQQAQQQQPPVNQGGGFWSYFWGS